MSEARRNLRSRAASAGFTLVELMVAMVIGLFLLAGVISIFVTSRESFRTNENLARIQENARFSFEILMREIREAGNVPCGMPFSSPTMANVVAATPPWWADWAAGTVVGYDGTQAAPAKAFGTGAADRVSGTDAITVLRPVSDESAIQIISKHEPAAFTFAVPAAASFAAGDVAIACDTRSGVLLKIGGVSGAPAKVTYGTTGAAANCAANLGYPTACGGTSPVTEFEAGKGMLAKFDPVFWYIGHNASGGKSLYRIQLTRSGGAPATEAQEMVSNVTDLQLDYLTRDATSSAGTLATTWVAADHAVFATGWSLTNTQQVVAVRLQLTFQSEEKVDAAPLQRKFIAVSALRSRDRL